MRSCKILSLTLFLFISLPPLVQAEIVTTGKDQVGVNITVYNSNLALVRDSRKLGLPVGESVLAFKEISSKIQPETAVLSAEGVNVVEQNYEYDLLSPESLMRKYLGRTITIMRDDGNEGEQPVQAVVLSTEGGVVLQVGDSIETALDGRVIYPDVPENLREKPTLTMIVENAGEGSRVVELAYLTRGLSWKADYVAELNAEDNRLDLKGWVTLTNNSGADYLDSHLQLVAGDVNRVRREIAPVPMAMNDMADARVGQRATKVRREELFEYHLYSVERPSTIRDNQSKQIALLQEKDGTCTKELVLRSRNNSYYWAKTGPISKNTGVEVILKFKNDKVSNFGSPKPAGIVRVYKKDQGGFKQFIGEDRIEHTPENESIAILLGKSFDVTADRVQTDFRIFKDREGKKQSYESEYEITLKNAKERESIVLVEEHLPGDWQIVSESSQHTKEDATKVSWKLIIAPKSTETLNYRLRTKL